MGRHESDLPPRPRRSTRPPWAAERALTRFLGASEGALRVVFQPLIDLRHDTVFAHEALVRPQMPQYTTPPALFEAATQANVVGELGREIRRLAVDGCPDFPLFLNVHPEELVDRWLVRPDDPLFYHDRAIYLEVTESVPLSHFELVSGILREVRGKGICLAVDDLGAGYSNLKYIADLAPEVVKLDRELVAGLDRQVRLRRLVRAIVRMCDDLGAEVVAEGIETREELEAVRDAGVRFGQGFYLARPANPPPTTIRTS